MGLPQGRIDMNQMQVALNKAGKLSTSQRLEAADKARRKRDQACARALRTRDDSGRFRSVQADRSDVANYARLERTLRQG